MLTLQRLLELMDVGTKTASKMTATAPGSEARRMLATLKVPAKFHDASMAEKLSESQEHAGKYADFDLHISNYFNPFSSQ